MGHQFIQMQRETDDGLNLNYYSLVLDAIKYFPSFKEKMLFSSQNELMLWEKVISGARDKGEIDSSLTNDQIASIFIHINNSIGMNNMLIGTIENTTSDLLNLWMGFYMEIKK
jgi:hypothetical protein